MKWIPSAFHHDTVKLTWKDLFLLALGKSVEDSACIVSRHQLDKSGKRL